MGGYLHHIAQRNAGLSPGAVLQPEAANPYFLLRSQAMDITGRGLPATRHRVAGVSLLEREADIREPEVPRRGEEPPLEVPVRSQVHSPALIQPGGQRTTPPAVQKEAEIPPAGESSGLDPLLKVAPRQAETADSPLAEAPLPAAPIRIVQALPVHRELIRPDVSQHLPAEEAALAPLKPVAPAKDTGIRAAGPDSIRLQPPSPEAEGKKKPVPFLQPATPVLPTPKVQQLPQAPRLVIGKLIVEVVPPAPAVIKEKQRAGLPPVSEPGQEWTNKLKFGLGQL